MDLNGLHHITMITGDAQRNVDFYADVLGLRLVKKAVNFDAPTAYPLYFGDETGAPGSILTWFEYAGARQGRPGAGMIHTIQLGVASADALDFWAERLAPRGDETPRDAEATPRGAPRAATRRPATGSRCGSPTGKGSVSSSSSPRAATRRCGPSTRRSPPSSRWWASRAPAPTHSTETP